MREIGIVTKRMMKLYLRNLLSVLFSFVYMLMFLVLISLFLGDYLAQGMTEVYARSYRYEFFKHPLASGFNCYGRRFND